MIHLMLCLCGIPKGVPNYVITVPSGEIFFGKDKYMFTLGNPSLKCSV